ncbi:MAG TPA: alpha/beta hydrolase [Candidatus Binataceae bacterium]|nr:alpha/beta hydrolase [Candidatus Binataceae bacterium]
MEESLGRFVCAVERPEPLKFAYPIVLLPDLFTSARHLGVLLGYFATIGWEVYAPDLRAAIGAGDTPPLAEFSFANLLGLAGEALDAIGRGAIVVGHGAGGLAALKLAERPGVKAAAAFAPLAPGYRSALISGLSARLSAWRRGTIDPPRGRTLFEFVADADPFQRAAIIRALVPESAQLAMGIARGEVALAAAAAPRLIVAGDSDIFAPIARIADLAHSLGAVLARLQGRGHWLIGGRALERSIGQTQRFLVRTLGQELLLLYPEEWKNEPDDG